MIETLFDRFGERFDDDAVVEIARMDIRYGPDPDDIWRYRSVIPRAAWDAMNPAARRAVKEVEQRKMHDVIQQNFQRMEEHLAAKNDVERIKESLPPIAFREKP